VWGLRAGADAAALAPLSLPAPPAAPSLGAAPADFIDAAFDRLRTTMDTYVGLRRTPDGLQTAAERLGTIADEADARAEAVGRSRRLTELRSAARVATCIAEAAAANDTSVGTHHVSAPTA
jgi:L-aspartate oxidase